MTTLKASSERSASGAPDAAGCCQPLDTQALSDEDAEAIALLFAALGDPARVKIMNLLALSAAPFCPCELEPALGLAQPTVSYHLKKLAAAGLVEREQRGKWAYFSINREAMAQLAGLMPATRVREETT